MFFRISPLFASIGASQADDSNVLSAWCDDPCIESATDQSEYAQAKFAVITSPVDNAHCMLEIHVSEQLESNPAFMHVLSAFPRVKFDTHYIVYTIKLEARAGDSTREQV